MKALFIGTGSIGQRHLRNYIQIKNTTDNILLFKQTNGNLIIEDGEFGLKAKDCSSISEYYGVQETKDFSLALKYKPDVVFICNPSAYHIEYAILLSKIGSHVFIEKPLTIKTDLIPKMEKVINKNKTITMVGYQNRFHKHIIDIKEILKKEKFGGIISARFVWNTYLPDHHPYENYRKGYVANQDSGGGVAFALSHDIDIIQHFFGMPEKVFALIGGKSMLNINAIDTVSSLLQFSNSSISFPVSLHLSFAQGREERKFEILMEKALLKCDLKNNTLKIIDNKRKIIIDKQILNFKRNDLFLAEMNHFLDSVLKKTTTCITVAEGLKSVKIADAIYKSVDSKKLILL